MEEESNEPVNNVQRSPSKRSPSKQSPPRYVQSIQVEYRSPEKTPLKKSTILNTSTTATPSTTIRQVSATPGAKNLNIEQTPSYIKSEARSLLKKLDSGIEDVAGAEELYALCLFANNRANMLDTGILSALALALKTKPDRIKEVAARILQLFAQDGGEACIMLKRLNMCNSAIEILSKSEDVNVQTPVVGLIYWLIQNPACKKEFLDMGADTYLKEINSRTKDPMLSRYLNYAVSSLSVKVKSREEMMQEILNIPKPQLNTDELNISTNSNLETLPYQTPSPRNFFNLFKTPGTGARTSSPSGVKRLDFTTPASNKTKTPEKV